MICQNVYFALPKHFEDSILKLYLRAVLLILISLQMLYISSALRFFPFLR